MVDRTNVSKDVMMRVLTFLYTGRVRVFFCIFFCVALAGRLRVRDR